MTTAIPPITWEGTPRENNHQDLPTEVLEISGTNRIRIAAAMETPGTTGTLQASAEP